MFGFTKNLPYFSSFCGNLFQGLGSLYFYLTLSPMNNAHDGRNICRKCIKPIYIHDVVAVCHFDGEMYHGRCFKFDNDLTL